MENLKLRPFLTAMILGGLLVSAGHWAAAVDCNRNGAEDTEDIATASSDDCNGNSVPDECEFAPVSFRFGEDFEVSRISRVVVAADFNGDGRTDIATGNQNRNIAATVSLLMNRGDETFDPEVKLDVGQQLSSMTAADLDQDGDADLVLVSPISALVLEGHGDGSFTERVVAAGETGADFVAVADVSGDAFPDLLMVSAEAGIVSVRVNRHDLSFDDPVRLAVGVQPTAVVPADFNGDGQVDLAVTNRESGSVSLLVGSKDGGFADAVHVDAGAIEPSMLVAEDLDGDNDHDLAIAGASAIAVLLNDGTGSFGPPDLFVVTPRSILAGDFDSDGDVDLAVGTRAGAVSALVNDGTGRFLQAANFRIAGAGRSIAAADMNDDGQLDVAVTVVSPDRVAILWNDGGGGRSGSAKVPFRDPVAYPVEGEPHGITLGDVDNDGDVDVITGNNEFGLAVLFNNGDGTFGAPTIYLPGISSFSVVAADFDGDGALDVASTGEDTRYLHVFQNTGDGHYRRAVRYSVRGITVHLSAGDLDNDGHPDLIVSATGTNPMTLFFNAGDGTFDRSVPLPLRTAPLATAISDLDGDGDLDIALIGGNIAVLRNRGDGSFGEVTNYPAGRGASFIVAGDVDRDGHVDLATANLGVGNVSVFWNRGNGTFGAGADYFIFDGPNSLSLGDADADGRPDIIAANPGSNTISVLLNEGGRLFSDSTEYRVGGRPRWALSADFDGDGVNDLVSANHDSLDVSVLLNETKPQTGQALEQICTDLDFHRLSVSASRNPVQRATKYVLPARDDDPSLVVPTLFQNVERFPFHEEFLADAFPDVFGDLTPDEYNQLIGRRASRDYYVGVLTRWPVDSGFRYSFTVVADTGFHPNETPMLDEVRWVYTTLSEAFPLAPLFYDPATELARRDVEENWPDPHPVPVDFGDRRPELPYEAYSVGIGFGRVRLLTLEEFEEENRAGRFTSQDIPVVGDAPRDIEGVVAGFFTARVQGELSHTAIRLARQGTPNAFVANALEVFAPYGGKLVRVEVCEGGYTVDDAVTPEEAEAFWAANRPALPLLPIADPKYDGLDGLLEMPLGDAEGSPPVARFGGKATNLARLQRILTGDVSQYVEPGFAIPMRFYLEFMQTNSIEIDGRVLSYLEYLGELFEAPEFQTDSVARSAALESFRKLARDEGVVGSELVDRLTQRIPEIFGSTNRMVRFRSSSNIEDALEFNGAGLYDSTSVCAADTLDTQELASSHCDATRSNERTIERALKRVWSSLWTFRAFEERAYFQIPQESSAMGILVSRAFLDEAVNGVAFTGNPRDSDDTRYVVTAQLGEESVVSPEPGITVERNLLTVVAGEVTEILRARSSSLVPPGETVLSDDQLRELGSFMAYVATNFPLELEGHAPDEVLLDFEFKIEADGSLAVKQVRPFLRPTASGQSPTFELEIPAGATVCGVFPVDRPGRDPRVEYEMKSMARFLDGIFELPTESGSFEGELFEEIRVGPAQEVAEPVGPGRFQVSTIPGDCNETTYRFDFDQDFTLPGGETFAIRLSSLQFTAQRDTPLDRLVLDDEYVTSDLTMEGVLDGEPVVTYSSCSYGLLPLWNVEATFVGGSLSLVERFLPSEFDLATGPAAVVRADLEVEGERRTVSNYWSLVYSARRHNRDVRYWVVLDPPLEVASVEAPVHVVELAGPGSRRGASASVTYLGENFETLGQPFLIDYDEAEVAGKPFRRGDVDANGSLNIADAIAALGFLFRRDTAVACEKSADANDDGKLSVSDAVGLLLHLFRESGPLPAPVDCGVDPSADQLTCVAYDACE